MKIAKIRHPQLKLYHLKPQTLKHVETTKVSDKPTYDTSFESSRYVTIFETLAQTITIKKSSNLIYINENFLNKFHILYIAGNVLKFGIQ